MLQKLSISDECFVFHQRFLKSKCKKLFSTLIIMRNVSCASNPHIRKISDESCDTEDWSKLHFTIVYT